MSYITPPARHSLIRFPLLLLLLVSPLGAPVLGVSTWCLCYDGFSSCPMPEPVALYFMDALFRPFAWNPLMGMFLLIVSTIIAGLTLREYVRLMWAATMERL